VSGSAECPPRDDGFRAPCHDSAPNRNFFRFTVVNCATHRVTQHGVSFLQFEELVTAKARKIGVKFNSKTPIGGSDFLRRGFGRQAKNKIVILFHTTHPIPFFAAAIATATPAATPLFSGIAL
jgi:hypothetical protein